MNTKIKSKLIGVVMIFDDNDDVIDDGKEFQKGLKQFMNDYNYKGLAYYKGTSAVSPSESGIEIYFTKKDKKYWKKYFGK